MSGRGGYRPPNDQPRGTSTLSTGLLMIPQGLGAMLTIPIAGRLTDKIGPGKIVLTGIGPTIPGMIAALQAPTHPGIARGSTLMNIVQQFASSVGTLTVGLEAALAH